MTNVLNSINSIRRVIESLPSDEMQHMKRVGELVEYFTKKLQEGLYKNENIAGIKYFGDAAFYHDIGKAWIPHDILTKPGKLTEEEMNIIKKHPLFAEQVFNHVRNGIVYGIPDYIIKLASDSAIYHHEWWNGNGYPYGIKQNKIPLVARITAICDAYDAMTSDRSYRKGHSCEYARQEIKRNAGIQFDPELAKAFISVKLEGLFYKNDL